MKLLTIQELPKEFFTRKGTLRRSNEFISGSKVLTEGFARTGRSGYSKGWSYKSIWTIPTLKLLLSLGFDCESGNDSPRKGASGEYIKLK